MFRRCVLSLILICGSSHAALAQSISLDAAVKRLLPMLIQLSSDSKDLNEMSLSHVANCDTDRLFVDLVATIDEAIDVIADKVDMMRVYAFISSQHDRARAGLFIAQEIRSRRKTIDLLIEKLVNTLGASQLPAGAAVIANRSKDNIRAAMSILESTQWPQP